MEFVNLCMVGEDITLEKGKWQKKTKYIYYFLIFLIFLSWKYQNFRRLSTIFENDQYFYVKLFGLQKSYHSKQKTRDIKRKGRGGVLFRRFLFILWLPLGVSKCSLLGEVRIKPFVRTIIITRELKKVNE